MVVVAYLALTALNTVYNPALMLGLVDAAVVWRITQRPASVARMVVVATGNATLAVLLSRTFGSMLIAPALTCLMALSLTSYPQLIDRRWVVIGLLVTSWVVPVVLEQLGVLARTWRIVGQTIELTSPTIEICATHTSAILIGTNVITIVVFGLFASALAAARRNAMRQAETQAWSLRQLLPAR